MPKYGTHKVVLDEALSGISNDTHRSTIMNNVAAANLGAIGPDLFFFSPEYEPFNTMVEIAKGIQKIKDSIDDVMYPFTWFKDHIIDEMHHYDLDNLLDTVFDHELSKCDMYRDKLDELRTASEDLRAGFKNLLLIDGLIATVDIVDDAENVPNVLNTIFTHYFEPGVQNNRTLNHWYWFDTLHYRQTGAFAQKLWELADGPGGTDRQKAYALGYLTHIATDVVGHSYVNTVVGGPYRTHIWRHVTVENYIDSWAYNHYKGKNVCCDLHGEMAFDDLHDDDNKCFNSAGMEIADLLTAALTATYAGPDSEYKTPLSAEDISTTFGSFKLCFDILYKDCIQKPVIPEVDYNDEVQELIQNLRDSLPSDPTHGCSLEAWFRGDCNFDIKKMLKFVAEVLKWSFESTWAVLTFLRDELCTVTLGNVLAGLSFIYDVIYTAWLDFRNILVLSGLATPYPEQLSPEQMTYLTKAGGCSNGSDYPYEKVIHEDISNLAHPRLFPGAALEEPLTKVNCADKVASPDGFITGSLPNQWDGDDVNSDALMRYAGSPSPENTLDIYNTPGAYQPVTMGNAVSLAKYMIDNVGNEDENPKVFCNWNLDADRGYGHKCWRSGQITQDEVEEPIEYLDSLIIV